jgi:hypothetical protein
VQGRGALKRELTACLRTGRALREPRARTRARGKNFVSDDILISARTAEVEDRAVPGHWEGDLIIGLNRSAIGTLVERNTRFTMLLHLPPMPGHGDKPTIKNGPSLAGRGAKAVREAIADQITTLPQQLRRSLTWDQGAEMAGHAKLRIQADLPVYFCDPQSPWQRGTNENTNGLLRQYFPKAPTCPDTTAAIWTLSPPPSTVDPARPWDGEPQQKNLTTIYYRTNKPVLQRPPEPSQYTSIHFGEQLFLAGMIPSIGSVGDAYDNALAETTIGLYKTEAVRVDSPFRDGPMRTLADVENITSAWVAWYNKSRLMHRLGRIPPIEFETAHYDELSTHEPVESLK